MPLRVLVSRRFAVLVALAAALALLSWHAPGPSASATTATGFLAEPVVAGLDQPTDFAFAPDGRMFVALRGGEVLVYQDGLLLGTFIDLPDVNSEYFRGLLRMALDPDFASNGYVYVYYVHENNAAAPQAPKTARLVRLTAAGNEAVPGSETVLLGAEGGDAAHPSCKSMPVGADCIPADGVDHFGGALRFAPDGTIFLSTGDAVDNRPDVQQLNALAGKLLHVNPDGSAPENNPFFTGDPTANESKVWAYGFRNPFRLAIQPTTGLPFVGDVGSFYWEELNIAGPGLNFGWPCYEGTAPHPYQNTLPVCVAFYQGSSPAAHPVFHYQNPVLSGGAAIVSGVFYTGTGYPQEYSGALFFGDFMQGWLWALRLDEENEIVGDGPETILADTGHPVAFQMGPDGNVYYLTQDFLTGIGQVVLLSYQPGNRPPVARASAAPDGGLAPLSVNFSSEGSYDADAQDLLFSWDFGDGASSSDANPAHTYPIEGQYEVQLTVEDPEGATSTTSLPVVAGDERPQAVITSPASGASYGPAQTVDLAGYGVDPEDGVLGGLHLYWTVILHHCDPGSGGCHSHLFQQMGGASISIITPDQAYELFYLEITLTATDSAGLKGSSSVVIGPDSDADGLLDQDELFSTDTERLIPDTDGDGCMDGAELGSDPAYGGQRDPLNFWDFFDTPDDQGTRDGTVDLMKDLFGVLFRFGAEDGNGTAAPNRDSDPSAMPPPPPAYAPAFDRSPPPPGATLWELAPPDGTIDLFTDIFGMVAQYGHSCAG